MDVMKKTAVCLSSGGKDSTLALHIAHANEIELKALLTVIPEDPESMLYHTHNVRLVEKIAEVIGLPWISVRAQKDREEESLQEALKGIVADYLVTGGIASQYQKAKFDRICRNTEKEHYAPLWGISARELYDKILELGMDVIIVSVAAYGLGKEWLGAHLDKATIDKLLKLAEKYRFNAVGEGGDLDTLVLDAPLYKRRLEIKKMEKKWFGDRGRLEIEEIEFEQK
jgi:ABC transporter with metal-binding/Fe-S-binding domain ATP-binding protein